METHLNKKVLVVSGFALTVVVAIVLGFYFSPLTDGSDHRQRSTKASLKGIGLTLQDFFVKERRYPSKDEGLRVLYPSQGSIVIDAWARNINYFPRPGDQSRPFELYSSGENGIDEGGTGDDINYWLIAK